MRILYLKYTAGKIKDTSIKRRVILNDFAAKNKKYAQNFYSDMSSNYRMSYF